MKQGCENVQKKMKKKYDHLRERARWTKSHAVIGYPRGQDGAILPARHCTFCSWNNISHKSKWVRHRFNIKLASFSGLEHKQVRRQFFQCSLCHIINLLLTKLVRSKVRLFTWCWNLDFVSIVWQRRVTQPKFLGLFNYEKEKKPSQLANGLLRSSPVLDPFSCHATPGREGSRIICLRMLALSQS